MKLAEIQTEFPTEENEGWAGWLVISVDDECGHISFRHEFSNARTGPGERDTWQDMGSGFAAAHLDAVIAALESARDRSDPHG